MMSVAGPVLQYQATPYTALNQRTDDDLMALARRGAKDAFETLVLRHQRVVRSVCARLCADACLGDDLAQEVFVVAWRRRHNFEPRGRFQSYLLTIAVNRSRNVQRHTRRKPEVNEECNAAACDRSPFDEVDLSERRRRLNQCVARLSADQQQVIALKYGADLDYWQIAEIMQRPEATIRSRAFLGLARLRRMIGKWGQL
jgi:RNA polymerase sigma-70 factor (ECF subfamily)